MTADRRYDLDWVRIAAFGVLILYHVGMFYVSWDWHVKSRRASEAIEPLMLLVNPWRLTLLFLVSGAATRFMADQMSVGAFTLSRMGRLWPPLLLAVFAIVPPQTYYQVVEAMQAPGAAAGLSVENFYLRYVTGSGNWCAAEDCLSTPTYNHMWFVAYLILYTLALIPLLPLLRRVPRAVSLLIAGPGLFLTPWLVMTALRATLFPIFHETHDFREDWYLHALYFSTLLFGFAVAKHQPFFDAVSRVRWVALIAAVLAWATLQAAYHTIPDDADVPAWAYVVFRSVRECQAWAAILAALGFAHRYLRHADGPVRRVLTEAIFPFYLIHQTLIVVAGHYLDAAALPLWLEAPLLIGATLTGCALLYLLGRAITPLRIWVGLRSDSGKKRAKTLHIAQEAA